MSGGPQQEIQTSIIDSFHHPFLVVDVDDYTVKMANSAAGGARLTTDSTCYALLHNRPTPCEGSEHPCPLEVVKRTGKPVTVEQIHYDRDGRARNVEVHAYPVSDRSGNVIQMIEYCVDITERKQLEEAVRRERDFADSLAVTAQAIVLVLDTEGRIIRFNPYMEAISGYRLEEVRGKDWFETFLPERDRARIRRLFLSAVGDIQTPGNVNSIVTRDGRELEIEWFDKTLRDGEGNRIGLLAVGQDVTERRQAERALLESEEQYRELYEWAPIAYVSVGYDGRVRKVNQSAVELLGYELEDLLDRPVLDLYADTPDGKEKARGVFKRFQAGLRIRDEELEMCKADGRTVWVSLVVNPVHDLDGRVIESRSMLVDITERKRAEQVLTDEVKVRYNYEEIAGKSAALQDVLKQAELVAPTDRTVLVMGETGSGKELICRMLHHLSARKSMPLIKLDCGTISPGLVESELFGHERGAFTGAIAQKQGRFELADGGTIFLDEIGDLPLETQMKLLRVLEEQEFERVGGSRTIRVDTRVIAATHRDLEQMVSDGDFRGDLFYRLNVFPITVPPLRDRKEDIPLLAHYFARRACAQQAKPSCEISSRAMERLLAYSWPGNVRELENIIDRAVILCGGGTIDGAHVQVEVGRPSDTGEKIRPMQEVEREHILAALQAADWKVSGKGGAAEALGMKPTTLESRMARLGIDRKQRR